MGLKGLDLWLVFGVEYLCRDSGGREWIDEWVVLRERGRERESVCVCVFVVSARCSIYT